MGGLNTQQATTTMPEQKDRGEYNPSVTPEAQATYESLKKAGMSYDPMDEAFQQFLDKAGKTAVDFASGLKNSLVQNVKYHRDASTPTEQSMDAIESGLKQAESKK